VTVEMSSLLEAKKDFTQEVQVIRFALLWNVEKF
jgi:hypothetical protein